MVGVEQALDIASKKLASFLKLEVQEVKIGYASYMTDTGQGFNEDTAVYYPFWKFSGVNTVKNQVLNVYVDMISGTVYYMKNICGRRYFQSGDLICIWQEAVWD